MLRVKPLMVACTADSSDDLKRNAQSVGFDLVITAPLTEKKVKELILPLLEKKQGNKTKKVKQLIIPRQLNSWSFIS